MDISFNTLNQCIYTEINYNRNMFKPVVQKSKRPFSPQINISRKRDNELMTKFFLYKAMRRSPEHVLILYVYVYRFMA